MSDKPAVDVRNLTAGYNGKPVLENLNFSIEKGCLAGLVGPNGAGKSTLIRVILGLHKPWQGEVTISHTENVTRKNKGIGYTPQAELVDWNFPITVADLVVMGRYSRIGLLKHPSKIDKEIALSSLERVNLNHLSQRRISELSGGEQRRMLIARALAQEASVILLDEPLAGLDATAQHDLLNLLDNLREDNKTLFIATHDLSCVAANFDHAVLLNKKVIAFGRPNEVFTTDLLSEAFERHLLVLPDGQKTLVGS